MCRHQTMVCMVIVHLDINVQRLLLDVELSTHFDYHQDLPPSFPTVIMFNKRPHPNTVHNVRIDQVRVIAALGDSITTGFAAKSCSRRDSSYIPGLNLSFENRGISFSMGGDPGAITLPNIISRFNRNITGASIGDHPVEFCYGDLCLPFQYVPSQDHFNAAQSGAMGILLHNSVKNVRHEIDYLVDAIESDSSINMKSDYKVFWFLS